ncbi:MAG: hypothetical protein LBT95_04290 [Treponema sp.]|jgi:hypothetical protein|nr:hypothetical protein [Treponema sp.]
MVQSFGQVSPMGILPSQPVIFVTCPVLLLTFFSCIMLKYTSTKDDQVFFMAKIAKKNGSICLKCSGISSLIFYPRRCLLQVLYPFFYISIGILAQDLLGGEISMKKNN